MYRLKEDYIDYFKQFKNKIYIDCLGSSDGYMSRVLNSRITCTESIAKSLICIRENLLFTDSRVEELLEKYFAKEK